MHRSSTYLSGKEVTEIKKVKLPTEDVSAFVHSAINNEILRRKRLQK